jgi:hypothetical protein
MRYLYFFFRASLGVLIAVTLLGCDDKEATDLAKKLNEVTTTYRKQIDLTNDAEQQAYNKLADIYAAEKSSDLFLTLTQERIERAGRFADNIVEIRKSGPTLSEIHDILREYINLDFENVRGLMDEESKAQAQYLSQLEKLKTDNEKLDALSLSFTNLAKRRSKQQSIQQLVSFFETTKQDVDKLACTDLATEIANIEKEIAKTTVSPAKETVEQTALRQAKAQSLTAELSVLNQQKALKKCN